MKYGTYDKESVKQTDEMKKQDYISPVFMCYTKCTRTLEFTMLRSTDRATLIYNIQ
jgi:hypothetical protein